MAGNKDVNVGGSQSTALALFLQNAADEAKRGENHVMTQYWYKLACQAANTSGGDHLYPSA